MCLRVSPDDAVTVKLDHAKNPALSYPDNRVQDAASCLEPVKIWRVNNANRSMPLDKQAILTCCTNTRDNDRTPDFVTAWETVITRMIIRPAGNGVSVGVGLGLVNMILTDQQTNSPLTPLEYLYS